MRNEARKTPQQASRTILLILSPEEHVTLTTLTRKKQSALLFWNAILAQRGIAIPSPKIQRIEPRGPAGEFSIRLEPRALSPKAIAEGLAFARFAESREAQQLAAGKWKNFKEAR